MAKAFPALPDGVKTNCGYPFALIKRGGAEAGKRPLTRLAFIVDCTSRDGGRTLQYKAIIASASGLRATWTKPRPVTQGDIVAQWRIGRPPSAAAIEKARRALPVYVPAAPELPEVTSHKPCTCAARLPICGNCERPLAACRLDPCAMVYPVCRSCAGDLPAERLEPCEMKALVTWKQGGATEVTFNLDSPLSGFDMAAMPAEVESVEILAVIWKESN